MSQMNGGPGHVNGESNHPVSSDVLISQDEILNALDLVHDPRTAQAMRNAASEHLERVKASKDAPYLGFVLADKSKGLPPHARHFGLSILDHVIRFRWTDYTDEQSSTIRQWTIQLGRSVDDSDPIFVRNKIAQIWVDLAKHCWALDWKDLDYILVELWHGGIGASRLLVLEILESLSENSFGASEDPVALLRGDDLNRACLAIFTPAVVLDKMYPDRRPNRDIKCGDEGWIARIAELLDYCNRNVNDSQMSKFAVKALDVLKSVYPWIFLGAIQECNILSTTFQTLQTAATEVQIAAADALYVLFSRTQDHPSEREKMQSLLQDLLQGDLLRQVQATFENTRVDPENVDSERYMLRKKLSEVSYNIGKHLSSSQALFQKLSDPSSYLSLLLGISQDESLHVSIPALHLWSQYLQTRHIVSSSIVQDFFAPLLELCSQRLGKYEDLPEDSNLPSILFLAEDIDTTPERHAFLGNYARFCKSIVHDIVMTKPFEALPHVLQQSNNILAGSCEEQKIVQEQYRTNSIPTLVANAQLTVVETAFKAYHSFVSTYVRSNQQPLSHDVQHSLEEWILSVAVMPFEDPVVQQKIVNVISDAACLGTLEYRKGLRFTVAESIMRTKIRFAKATKPKDTSIYGTAVDGLQKQCSHNLVKIATLLSDSLASRYSELESLVEEYVGYESASWDDRERSRTVLFTIIQRASGLEDQERLQRLEGFVDPIIQQWQDPVIDQITENLEQFCNISGITAAQEYLLRHGALKSEDWTTRQLDEEGLRLRANLEDAQQRFPLRLTKTFLTASLSSRENNPEPRKFALAVWSKHIPVLLPRILKFLQCGHSFSQPESWQGQPDVLQIVNRVLKDRFWSVAISKSSRDEFYDNIVASRGSFEGLGSCLRAFVRYVREVGYILVTNLALFGESFFGIPELAGHVVQAYFSASSGLSIHQTIQLLESSWALLISCPVEARQVFLTPFMSALFVHIDTRSTVEWNSIDQSKIQAQAGDDLDEEMKSESILRVLTYKCVNLVADIFAPQESIAPPPPSGPNRNGTNTIPPRTSFRSYALEEPEVLKPIILFCTHALRMHDDRACSLIIRVLRSIVPEFIKDTPIARDVREYISTEIFRTCLESVHDQYFVEIQNELTALVTQITASYGKVSETPRSILLSLPNMDAETVDRALHKIFGFEHQARYQRAVMLKLLEGVRAVSVSQQGNLPKMDIKKVKNKLLENYMTVDVNEVKREDSPGYEGIAEMYA